MLNEKELTKVQAFLKRAQALYPTQQYSFSMSEKNKLFNRQYNLPNQDKIEIMKSLCAEDCVAIRKNDNCRYPYSDVFVFIKSVEVESYGETEEIKLYIKDYIIEQNALESVIIISFHEEGLYED